MEQTPTKEELFFAQYWEAKHGTIKEIMPSHVCELMKLYSQQQAKEQTIKLKKYFEKLRFSESNHLGLGDIRLTIGQQEEIVELFLNENK